MRMGQSMMMPQNQRMVGTEMSESERNPALRQMMNPTTDASAENGPRTMGTATQSGADRESARSVTATTNAPAVMISAT